MAVQALIQNFVRSTLTLTFVIAAARVVFSIKAQMMEERRWQMELRAEVTRMRRVEAVDKLLSVLTLLVASVFGLQAIGLDGACAGWPCIGGWLYLRMFRFRNGHRGAGFLQSGHEHLRAYPESRRGFDMHMTSEGCPPPWSVKMVDLIPCRWQPGSCGISCTLSSTAAIGLGHILFNTYLASH